MTANLLPHPASRETDAVESTEAASKRSYDRQIAWAVTMVAVIALFTAAYYARAILLPTALAVMLNLALKPLVLRLERSGVPPAVSAGVIIVFALGLAVAATALVWQPAKEWVRELPAARGEIAAKLKPLRDPVESISDASEEVEKIAKGDEDAGPVRVQLEQPGIASSLLNTSTAVLAAGAIVVVLLYFLLATGDGFLSKLVELSPTWRDKRNVVALAGEIQQAVSHYLLTISLINIGLGTAIGTGMWMIGLPNPVLWGVMACLFNYIPFVGAVAGAGIVFAVALLEFDLGTAALAPTVYLGVNLVEANFITPTLLGRSTSLNPVAIVLSLTLWGWMWGIGGVFLAIPILVVVKIACDHIDSLQPVGRLLEAQSGKSQVESAP